MHGAACRAVNGRQPASSCCESEDTELSLRHTQGQWRMETDPEPGPPKHYAHQTKGPGGASEHEVGASQSVAEIAFSESQKELPAKRSRAPRTTVVSGIERSLRHGAARGLGGLAVHATRISPNRSFQGRLSRILMHMEIGSKADLLHRN